MKIKRCSLCGGRYPIGFFHRNTSRGDGHAAYCKDCASQDALHRRTGTPASYITAPTPEEINKRAAARRRLEAMRDEKRAADYF